MRLSRLEYGWILPVGGTQSRPLQIIAGMAANDWMWGLDPNEPLEQHLRHLRAIGVYLPVLYPAQADSEVMAARQEIAAASH